MKEMIGAIITDKSYMKQAYEYANEYSQDPDTKSGCILIDGKYNNIVFGTNRIPSGSKLEPYMLERPAKYSYLEHCERDAIYQAVRLGISLLGWTLYVNWQPCMECARALISSGIKRVVIHKEGQETYERLAAIEKGGDWHEYDSVEFMRNAGIQVDILSMDFNGEVLSRFRGKDIFM